MKAGSANPVKHEVVASKFLTIFELGSTAAIADGMRRQRHIVPVTLAQTLDRLRVGGYWEDAIAKHAPELDSTRWLRFLTEQGYLQIRGQPEDESLLMILRDLPELTFPKHTSSIRKVKALYLAHCAANWLARNLGIAAYMRGMPITVSHSTHNDRALIQDIQPDLVIVEPFDLTAAARFWNTGAVATDSVRLDLVETLKSYFSGVIDDLRPHAVGRLILLKGITTPALRPHGFSEFRREVSMDSMAHAVNDHIASLLRPEANMIFIDEQHLFSSMGVLEMMPTSGPYGNFFYDSRGVATRMVAALCEEYLDAYAMWSGVDSHKCVVVDLDNTLWPGVIGEGGGIPDEDSDARTTVGAGTFGGLHQALGVLKSRGILLATCSRNNRDEVLSRWKSSVQRRAASAIEPFLSPDDFALHEIGWDRKPVAMTRILDRLGLEPRHVVFVDDDPLQREQMRYNFPRMRVIGENLNLVRVQLLSDPRLQVNIITEDARERTDTTRASLAREASLNEVAGSSSLDFMRTLNLELRVRRLSSRRFLPRVAELLQRTNQFNLTGYRPDVGILSQLIDSDTAALFDLNVRDRFGDYGTVGICLLIDNKIANVAISCRVIAMDVALPFLCTVVNRFGFSSQVLYGRVVLSDRNIPCRNLLQSAGFDEIGPHQYVKPANRECRHVDSSVYKVTCVDESNDREGHSV